MTHDEWEKGGRLTIHKATNAQLKWMLEDRDSTINRMYKELEEKDKVIDGLCAMIHKLTEGENNETDS